MTGSDIRQKISFNLPVLSGIGAENRTYAPSSLLRV